MLAYKAGYFMCCSTYHKMKFTTAALLAFLSTISTVSCQTTTAVATPDWYYKCGPPQLTPTDDATTLCHEFCRTCCATGPGIHPDICLLKCKNICLPATTK
ncbi:hypothetical protein FRC02_006832 [Tulasnella sp. 418]|nr:hypothetical protein FRC02_006832 [Tulasnella sp. 418]